MYEACELAFLYLETPLHAGTGRGLGAVDLPIQRERTTGYPIIQASGIKGKLRAEAKEYLKDSTDMLFGSEDPGEDAYAGSLSIGDARILLFPVRSLTGVFAWVTSFNVLSRFVRDATTAGIKLDWSLPAGAPDENTAWVSGSELGSPVVLEEFSFNKDESQAVLVSNIGKWIAKNALPDEDEYSYWKDKLPKKLCILSEDAFRDFVLYSTEVQTHIKLDSVKKTVGNGMLFTSESLPTDTLMYTSIMATKPRNGETAKDGKAVLAELTDFINDHCSRTNFGGDETTGQGFVSLTCVGGVK